MSLNFIGEEVIFLPGRDAVGAVALDQNRLVRWYTARSALEKLGPSDVAGSIGLVDCFQRYRPLLERAANMKYEKGKVERDGSIWIAFRDIEHVSPGKGGGLLTDAR